MGIFTALVIFIYDLSSFFRIPGTLTTPKLNRFKIISDRCIRDRSNFLLLFPRSQGASQCLATKNLYLLWAIINYRRL